METNIEYTNFFEDVVGNLATANMHIMEVNSIINSTKLVDEESKKTLLDQIDSMVSTSTAIYNKLAELGEVK